MDKVLYYLNNREPAMAAAVAASIALTGAGVIVDPNVLVLIFTVVVPIIAGLLVRSKVVPQHTLDEIEKGYEKHLK